MLASVSHPNTTLSQPFYIYIFTESFLLIYKHYDLPCQECMLVDSVSKHPLGCVSSHHPTPPASFPITVFIYPLAGEGAYEAANRGSGRKSRSQGLAYARIGILGNPSDGYQGQTLSCTIDNYFASAQVLSSGPLPATQQKDVTCLRLVPSGLEFSSFMALFDYCALAGTYATHSTDGTNLLLASIKVFVTHTCAHLVLPLNHLPTLEISFTTSIPRQLGLAGSSAICMATFRALALHFGISIHPDILAQDVHRVEAEELGVACGLQDRVAQAYDGPTAMDFRLPSSPIYTRLSPPSSSSSAPQSCHWMLLFATTTTANSSPTKSSGQVHSGVKQRWLAGDQVVRDGMVALGNLVPQAVEAWNMANWPVLVRLMNTNFKLRCDMFGPAVSPQDRKLVALAQGFTKALVGAKLPGSGGCVLALVVGKHPNDDHGGTKDRDEEEEFVSYMEMQGVRVERLRLRGITKS